MNDLETLSNILTNANIIYTQDIRIITLTVEEGYAGFCTVFQFNTEGKLLNMLIQKVSY